MEIEFALLDAGYRVGGPLKSCVASENWLSLHRPDFAIVDARLDDGFCENVARKLKCSGVPFVVCSGWIELTRYPTLAAAPRLRKPIDFQQLLGLVNGASLTSEAEL